MTPSIKKETITKDIEAEPVCQEVEERWNDSALVKRFKRKADFILLPILTFAYLVNSLDRSNLSNAHTANLEKDLGLVGNQYNQVLTYYQIPFVVFGPFATLCTKRFGAKWSITTMLLGFGSASLATGWVKHFHTLVVCRVFVGLFESGFLASIIYYLSIWYTRKELGTRLGIFYAALTASSAFGGLLAFGMFQIDTGHYFRWSYLFFLEGGLTLCWAIVIFFALPSDTQSAWFLSDAEKQVAVRRLQVDSVQNLEQKFNLKEALSEFTTFHGYLRCVLGFAIGVVLTSNANFLAMIVARLGYSTVKTNLYTVAPALTGAVFLVAWCKSSDYFRERGLHIAAAGLLSLIGYVILVSIGTDQTGVLYFAMFICTTGAYPATPLNAAWAVANIPNLNARALTSGLIIACANCGGFLSSNIYLREEAPRYITALNTNIGMCITILVLAGGYSCWMRWENRKRDKAQNVVRSQTYVTEGVSSMRDESFRFQV
ncbi:MFS-type transporter efuF [Exophiala dermatitidis]